MLKSIFGFPIKYEEWSGQRSLPFYIANGYLFSTMYIGDKRCIAIKPKAELATIPSLKKQIKEIQKIDNVPVILDLDGISFYRRKSFIENSISFLTSKQAFLPFIGTMLTNENERNENIEKFVFSTQQLFLLYLYSRQNKFYVASATQILPFTAMTLTRAVKQLAATDLFIITKDGVNRVIESKYDRTELFEKARKYLQNPIRKWGYIDKKDITSNMVFAGETVLSEKTMLNPTKLVTYATWSKNFDNRKLTNELLDPQMQVRLELWAYEPRLFSSDNTADSLSVALSFEGNHDERIEEAIEELKNMEFEND